MPDQADAAHGRRHQSLTEAQVAGFDADPEMEKGRSNGHEQPVSPFKQVLQRTVPQLNEELEPAVNVFDPWAGDRGTYYSLAWEPRAGAESDDAFRPEAD